MKNQTRLERAIEKLLAGRSPRSEARQLSRDEQRMLRMAQLLRGARGQAPDPEFRGRLQEHVVSRQRGISRRGVLLSAFGSLAAGVAAGVALDRMEQPSSPATGASGTLVGENGRWFLVAHVADVPDGTILSFDAGALQGFLINQGGSLRALSRICTHMGCILNLDRSEQAFVCPCHGAEFDISGKLRYGLHGYGQPLPPLPGIQVRANGEAIEVWSI